MAKPVDISRDSERAGGVILFVVGGRTLVTVGLGIIPNCGGAIVGCTRGVVLRSFLLYFEDGTGIGVVDFFSGGTNRFREHL